VEDYGQYQIIGRTRDDAAGEAFDKVARAIGLGYPGGPKIDRLAQEGDKNAISFPRAKIVDAPDDFSFSGLKSAVLNYLNHCEMKNIPVNRADVAASFQQAVIDVLTDHTIAAAKRIGIDRIAIAGGVAANSSLREQMKKAATDNHMTFYHPSPVYCTDNAAMIGVAGYYEYIKGARSGWDLNAVPNLKIGER
jgi:N6-L-threonylcarbamoyladenine synthase